MDKMNFTEEDKQKVVKYLNMVAAHAKFDLKTSELIEYFNLLAHMQKDILPKLNANILEVKKIVEAQEESQEESRED